MLLCGCCVALAAGMAQSFGFSLFTHKPHTHVPLAEPSSVLLSPNYLAFESEGEEESDSQP